MAVRAYRLAEPREIELGPEHGGCKSWLTLGEPIPLAGMTPALGDAEYAERIAAVRTVLEREPVGTAIT